MDPFEKEFEALFPMILKRTGAFLNRLYPPMRMAGLRGTMPCFVQTGRALFDVVGWMPIPAEFLGDNGLVGEHKLARVIGIEQKANRDAKSSMRIVGEDGSGSGLQAHQLEALAAVHRSGGIARVLWNNGGIVGVLDGDAIAASFYAYGVSVQAEKMRKKPAAGSRSISWKLFRQIDFEAKPEDVIVVPKVDPTVSEVLKARQLEARKLINEDDETEVDASAFDDSETPDGGGL